MEYGLAAHARNLPGKVALVCEGERLTFAELDANVNRLARALAERGVRAGGRVALMLRNSFAFFEANQAAAKLGATIVPINFHLKRDEIAYICADSGAVALVFDAAEQAGRTDRGLGEGRLVAHITFLFGRLVDLERSDDDQRYQGDRQCPQ